MCPHRVIRNKLSAIIGMSICTRTPEFARYDASTREVEYLRSER